MNSTHDHWRERLLEVEQITPSLKERYDKEIQMMLEKKLTGFRRWIWLAQAVASLAFAVFFGTLAVTLPAAFPWPGRLGLAGGVVFAIGWAALGIRVFRRGSLDLKIDTGAIATLSWCLPVFLVTIFMVWAPDSIAGLRMILFGLVFLVGGAVFLIRHVIERSELNAREKLLEIEYRLAELTEALKPPTRTPQA
jgi:hypothetical protein